MLILEQGAQWPSWAASMRLRAPNAVVEMQTDGENMVSFERRVESRLHDIREKGQRLRAVGYVCAVHGWERWDARERLARRLLGAMTALGGSELILAGGSWDSEGYEGQQRARLVQVWSELSAENWGQQLSIRFEDGTQDSGVFRAAYRLHQGTPLLDSQELDLPLEKSS